MNLDSFPNKTSCSTVNQIFILRWPSSLSAETIWFWSKPSDSRCVCDPNAVFRCLLAEPTSLVEEKKKKSKKVSAQNGLWSFRIALKIFSDQNNVRLKLPLIRPFRSLSGFWSYYHETEVTSDHIISRPKWTRIIPSPDRSNLWSYHLQTKVNSDHNIPRPMWPLIIPSQTEVISDQTIARSDQIPVLVILVWEHTMCNGLGLTRVHFRMAPQPGYMLAINTVKKGARAVWNFQKTLCASL